jgi:Na+-translocating ferredoxin:NAD+ oxidoreductase RnfC subunit
VNYQDVEGTIKVLEDNHIDTVICAINDKSGRGPEPDLIKAVAGSKVTKRYIPAMWGIPYTEE